MGMDSRDGSTGDVKDNGSAMNLKEIFRTVQTILVIDWPSKELPEALTRAGFHVVVRGGPRPEDHSAYELHSSRNLAHDPGEVVVRHIGRAPERADLIYSYRPLSELPEIITTAKRLGAHTIWTQSGLSAAGVIDRKRLLGAGRGTAAGAKPRGISRVALHYRAIYRRRGSEVTEKVADGFCAVVDDRTADFREIETGVEGVRDWIGRVEIDFEDNAVVYGGLGVLKEIHVKSSRIALAACAG